MRLRISRLALVMTGVVVLGVDVPVDAAEPGLKCQKGIGSAARTYVRSRLKLVEKCHDDELATPGKCPAPDPEKIQKMVEKLRDTIAKKCFGVELEPLGFPDECEDTTAVGFSLTDLQDCIVETHTTTVTILAEMEGDPTLIVGSFDKATLLCQSTISKAAARFLDAAMKSLQRCRNDVLAGKLIHDPAACASEPRTAAAIAKARAKAEAQIIDKCSDAQVTALEVCEPDQTEAPAAATCILDAKAAAAERLVEIEYPIVEICGDDEVNRAIEECDGDDDAACPGQCGEVGGCFECLCLTHKRERVVEHANADLDIGWKGLSHDSKIVEGGGYVTDLWDCDGPGGPDTVCLVGPSCSLPPHSFCRGTKNGLFADVGPPYENGDAFCQALGQGTCRKTLGGATGPHCEIDFQQECDTNAQCPTLGDRCVKVAHGAPLPLSAGAVEVCIQNYFTEDVVGTTDLATGAGGVRMRQVSRTYLGGSSASPCPVCGGFCAGSPNTNGPGGRLPCTTNADCLFPPSLCVTDPVCSWGARQDKPCRPDPPFGGPTALFGNPSQDCPVSTSQTLLGSPDILFNPVATDPVTRIPNVPCTNGAFAGKACLGGGNDGRACVANSECPAGSCNHQCFCNAQLLPNYCEPACRGGTNDEAACDLDSECPGGFCHAGDCRLDPFDLDSAEEGRCTSGPADRGCSTTTYQGCMTDADCQPSPSCPRCQTGETCDVSLRPCFVHPIHRNGAPGVPDRVGAAIFCIPATSPIVDAVAGLAGPGALTQPETSCYSGF